MNKNYSNLKFLITTTTLSSGNLANTELKKFNNAIHRYFPFDVPFLIDQFLLLWKPNKIFLVDSEIWPNLILKSKKYKIPIALINARITSKSFNRWMIFPNVAKKIFKIFDLYICSNNETKKYLEKLNLKNIYFKGNIKLIDHSYISSFKNCNENFLSKKRIWIAASIHKNEDIICLNTHLKLKKKFSDIVTIIAPRHIDRADKIRDAFERLNLNVQVLNKNDSIVEGKEIVIINFFGALQSYFKYSKSVFIGKSMDKKLKNIGGQNPIEAAKLECKIYHGPYVYNFEDIYKILSEKKISKKIENYEELSDNLARDLEGSYKQVNQISNPIKDLGHQTLADTMVLIRKFLSDDVY